ncbi:septin 5b isoform X1, partial [Tachysurus ichikawai]
MYLFLILSNLVTPKENLNILSSATSSSDSCLFSDTVSKPYSMAGLATVLYTFPLILADISYHTELLTPFSTHSNLPALTSLPLPQSLHYSGLLTPTKPPPLQVFLHLLPALTTDHNVICKHHHPRRLLADLL